MAWVILIVAGLLEVVWAYAMKVSDGFTKLTPSILSGRKPPYQTMQMKKTSGQTQSFYNRKNF